jgi:hypothetical protein
LATGIEFDAMHNLIDTIISPNPDLVDINNENDLASVIKEND